MNLVFEMLYNKNHECQEKIMNFKTWLEGIEEYEPFRDIVSSKAYNRKFPFDSWFPEERIYLPFDTKAESSENEQLKKDLSSALEDNGYEIVDLQQGYAKPKNKKQVYGIGKLLVNLQYKDLKKIESNKAEYSPAKYSYEVTLTNNYWNDLKERFEKRGASGKFLVVISKNIHDIASMSTGRGWESCMKLGTGAHYKDVYCEVANGGFVAYLIREDDKNIEHPISRIHIRRFDNKSGNSIALPEESMYGEEIPYFLEIVKNWIQSKQGKIEAGKYSRMGGKYSDTWGSERSVLFQPDPKDIQKIGGWLTKWLNLSKDDQKKYYQYFLKGIQSFFQSNEEFPPKFIEKLKKFIFSDSIFYTGSWNQKTGQFMPAFAVKYPQLINKDEFLKAFNYSIGSQNEMLEKLVKTFPQYMTEDLFKSIKDHKVKEKIVKVKPEFSSQMDDAVKEDAQKNLTPENPEFKVKNTTSIYQVSGRITDELDKLQRFKPIPEPLIRKVVEFANKRNDLQLIDPERIENAKNPLVKDSLEAEADVMKYDILGHIIHVFGMTKSDTPTVQRFYQSLLPDWDKVGGIGVLGWGIAQLGENGKQFLPFIENKRDNLLKAEREGLSTWDHQSLDQSLESYNYVIDVLRSGTGYSKKHRMYYGKGYEWQVAQKENKEKKQALRDAIIHKK
jgi:hypothetical protein